MKKLTKFTCLLTSLMLSSCLFGCEPKTKNYTFDDISIKINEDFKTEEFDVDENSVFSSKRALIHTSDDKNDKSRITLQWKDYGDDLTDSELIERPKEQYYNSDKYEVIDKGTLTINDIEMQYHSIIGLWGGIDPIKYYYFESYYFVHNNKLYEIYYSFDDQSTPKSDFTDDFKEKLFESDLSEELRKMVETIELN